MKKMIQKLPFRIDRNLTTSLVDQVVDGFRQAIACGDYRAGDTLPTIRALAPQLGVSVRVTAEAVRVMTAEGLIAPRSRRGCVVLDRKEPLWKGRVLLVLTEGDYGYNQMALIGRLRTRLLKAGYLFIQVTVPLVKGRRYDTSALDIVLGRPIDMAVVLYDIPVVLNRLVKSGVRFVSAGFDGDRYRGCVGSIRLDYSAAIDSFVRHCLRRGIRRFVQVGKGAGEISVEEPMRAAGLSVEVRNIPLVREARRLDAIQTATITLFREWAEKGDPDWPELFYFTDDYLATAAILALEHLRVRIPEDVEVATFSNLGHGPVSWGTLTRIEIDPVRQGEVLADEVLDCLTKGEFRPDVRFEPTYLVGESFAER